MPVIDDAEIHRITQQVINQVLGVSKITPGETTVSPAPEKPVPQKQSQVIPPNQSGMKKVVALGSDHGGFDLRNILKTYLEELGYDIRDVGAYNKDPVDYPDFAHEVARQVSNGTAWRGIMIDGAGIGSCIVANKVPGIRAGMAFDYSSAINSREHNDTNVLTLGAGLIGTNLAKQIVKVWLETDFGGGRHIPRIEKISNVEKNYLK
jgi:ribose 5-phosphate isomerase B